MNIPVSLPTPQKSLIPSNHSLDLIPIRASKLYRSIINWVYSMWFTNPAFLFAQNRRFSILSEDVVVFMKIIITANSFPKETARKMSWQFPWFSIPRVHDMQCHLLTSESTWSTWSHGRPQTSVSLPRKVIQVHPKVVMESTWMVEIVF